MAWKVLNFGRHKNKTLPQVLFSDPDWFFWAYETGVFGDRSVYREQADVLHAKATSIRVPQSGSERHVVEYTFYYSDHTSVGFEIVEATRPAHAGSTPTSRATYIDMSVPRRQRDYDKLGYRIFLGSLKHALFGSDSARMTR